MRETTTHRLLQSAALLAATCVLPAACSSAPPGAGEDVGSTSSAVSPSDKTAYDFFVGKGLKSFQAAAIVGNLDQESSMNPTIDQEGGGPGRGIAQWSAGGRWDTDGDDNVQWYARKEGQAADSLKLQLEFVWYELSTFPEYGLHALRDTSNVTSATIAFQTDFEGCGECDQSKRLAYAEAALRAYGGSTPPSSTTCTGGAKAVTRAKQWSDAKLDYCQASYKGDDYDAACWSREPVEGGHHVCDRESNSAWNAYRSDCSGLVSWSWGLPPNGGGVTTLGLAPFSTAVSKVIPAESLEPGDAVNNADHVMLFAGWVSGHSKATFIQEPGCSASPSYAFTETYDVSISGSSINVPGVGMKFTAIRYNGNGCESGTGSSSGGTSNACYSETLGRKVADNTCVQSRSDTHWYQCDSGSWVDRFTDSTACAATYPLGYTGTGSSGGTGCESETLRRKVADNACVQSDMNSEWYQCANGNWTDRWTDPTACNGVYPLSSGSGNHGASCHSDTLKRTMPDNACVESSSNDDWYQCDNGSWTDRWTDPAACNGVYPLATHPSSGGGTAAPSGGGGGDSKGDAIKTLALDNVGKRACSQNSKGGQGFASSCYGDADHPEWWCADFARWVWGAAGVDTAGLDAGAGSFYVYGQTNHTLHDSPSVGDAVVFNYSGGAYADHVAIVVAVSGDTIETVSGDWGVTCGSEIPCASTSTVQDNGYYSSALRYSSTMGMTISGFVSPH